MIQLTTTPRYAHLASGPMSHDLMNALVVAHHAHADAHAQVLVHYVTALVNDQSDPVPLPTLSLATTPHSVWHHCRVAPKHRSSPAPASAALALGP